MKSAFAGAGLCWRLLASILAVAASVLLPFLALKALALLAMLGEG